MASDATPPESPKDRITFSLRRTHVYAVGGLVLGLAAGVSAGRWSVRGEAGQVRPAGGAPTLELPAGPAAASPDAATLKRALDVEGRAVRGPAGAPVTIVEFTDYQCPFCRQYFEQTLGPLLDRFDGRIRYAVKNYPIAGLHPQAFRAAEAAECAAEQDRFWEYHDELFRTAALERADLDRIARDTGLDGERFAACLDGRAMSIRVQRDVADGNAIGITGTPTFFVNGRKIEGALPLDAFVQAIEAALSGGSHAGGTSP